MPSRNVRRTDIKDGYYHVYGRGISKSDIFLDDEDYAVFLNLFKRYLGEKPSLDNNGRKRKNYHGQIKLLAFCLMPNHFHLLFHQIEQGTIAKVMQGVNVSYVKHFNQKYRRSGPLLESRFKASLIANDDYLMYASRYIHLNPGDYNNWKWSSLPYYIKGWKADWLTPEMILEITKQYATSYKAFVDENKTKRDELKEKRPLYLDEYDDSQNLQEETLQGPTL